MHHVILRRSRRPRRARLHPEARADHRRPLRHPDPHRRRRLAGRDLCGRAPTGSGKTIAFGIPLVARVGARRARSARAASSSFRPASSPRRSAVSSSGSAAPRKLRVAAVYGGAGFGLQLKALRRGVDMLVACPGRLTDLIERGEVDLDEVEIVVVDEADRMADMGFLPAVQAPARHARPTTRQTLLFSATLDGAVDTLVRRYQRDPVRHVLPETPTDKPRATHRLLEGRARRARASSPPTSIKLAGPTIVFCKTKHGTDALAKKLDQAGVRTEAIHGNRSQGQRERALASFADGQGRRARRHRRRRPRHPRRRRRLRRALRPAERREGLHAPLGSHRPRRRRRHGRCRSSAATRRSDGGAGASGSSACARGSTASTATLDTLTPAAVHARRRRAGRRSQRHRPRRRGARPATSAAAARSSGSTPARASASSSASGEQRPVRALLGHRGRRLPPPRRGPAGRVRGRPRPPRRAGDAGARPRRDA